MTGSQDLSELLERVEGATGADRDIDAEIAVAFSGDPGAWVVNPSPHSIFAPAPGWWRTSDDTSHDAPAFTASLDAALALVERVLPDWNPNLRKIAHPGAPNTWWESSVRISPLTTYVAECDTPALAILNALLKALQAQASDTQHGSQS